MFPSTCLTILLSRCEDANCTKRYLVKQPLQLLLRVEKDEKKLCFELWPFVRLSLQSRRFLTGTVDSPQLSGSFNVQDGGISLFPKKKNMDRSGKYHCFAGYIRLWPLISPTILDQE